MFKPQGAVGSAIFVLGKNSFRGGFAVFQHTFPNDVRIPRAAGKRTRYLRYDGFDISNPEKSLSVAFLGAEIAGGP